MTRLAMARAGLALVLLAGCATAAGRIENGMFYSAKGYRVTLPPAGWKVDTGQRADLALRAEARGAAWSWTRRAAGASPRGLSTCSRAT